MTREYFYYLDYHGRLFLAETLHRNFTSCYKDVTFLNFFFNRIETNNVNPQHSRYKWLSKCGPELNFVEAQDTPIVYHKLEGDQLLWGGTLKTPFNPENLFVSRSNGRIYHPLPDKKKHLGGYALLSSDLVLGSLSAELNDSYYMYQGSKFKFNFIE